MCLSLSLCACVNMITSFQCSLPGATRCSLLLQEIEQEEEEDEDEEEVVLLDDDWDDE